MSYICGPTQSGPPQGPPTGPIAQTPPTGPDQTPEGGWPTVPEPPG
jgi:hypothetical protein